VKTGKVPQCVVYYANFHSIYLFLLYPNRDKPTFDVDLKLMKRKFLLLQQKAHPDSFSQAPKVKGNKDGIISKYYYTNTTINRENINMPNYSQV
jgi:hypothetical protein